MADPALLNAVILGLSNNTWESKCINNLVRYGYNWTTGLVDEYGAPLPALTDNTWGVDLATCNQFCGSSRLSFTEIFSFERFSAAATNYFLPWLALTAQLPFESGSPANNVMAFCLAVGSPALATYSLTLTILNRLSVNKRFAALQRRVDDKQRHEWDPERIYAVGYLLHAAQQVPLRLSQGGGWLSSLLVHPKNQEWWKDLRDRLEDTQRGFTASLCAQMILAVVAYLFTVVSSFEADLGDITTGTQMASGSLWIWLVPVILGWIIAGTQFRSDTIAKGLRRKKAWRAPGALPSTSTRGPTPTIGTTMATMATPGTTATASTLPPSRPSLSGEPQIQYGILVDCAIIPQVQTEAQLAHRLDAHDTRRLKVPTWFGCSVLGDEQVKGPAYNYARLLTWWRVSDTLEKALDRVIETVNDEGASRGHQNGLPPGPTSAGGHSLDGDALSLAQYADLGPGKFISAYPKWNDIDPGVFSRVLAATIAALFVQWGTAGASIMVGYMTPTVGLGCRSGSYLLYAGLGTLTLGFLLISMLLSHEVALRYERQHQQDLNVSFSPTHLAVSYSRTTAHTIVCAAAVITRYVGKLLALLNTVWLIFSSVMEMVGGLDTCWCKGSGLSHGSNTWVTLFKTVVELQPEASAYWGGSLALSLSIIMSYLVFVLICWW